MYGKEPTIVFGALSELIRAIIPMLIIFGLIHWTGEQVAAFMVSVGAAIGFATVLLTRSQTVSHEIATQQIVEGIKSPAGTTVQEVVNKVEANQ